MAQEEKRIVRNYNVKESTQEWLEKQAAENHRSTIKQVEVIIEEARQKAEG